ncbi:hypothetical protein BsWGS_10565 [Bradybaena similaris]
MATKKDEGKEVNYVGQLNFWKENYDKVKFIQREKWPDEWGYIVPLYQEAYDKVAQGNTEPLPEKATPVKREIFASFEPLLENTGCRSVPPPDSQMYGWKVGCSIVETVDKWIEARPQVSMYKQLGWGWDSQP